MIELIEILESKALEDLDIFDYIKLRETCSLEKKSCQLQNDDFSKFGETGFKYSVSQKY